MLDASDLLVEFGHRSLILFKLVLQHPPRFFDQLDVLVEDRGGHLTLVGLPPRADRNAKLPKLPFDLLHVLDGVSHLLPPLYRRG